MTRACINLYKYHFLCLILFSIKQKVFHHFTFSCPTKFTLRKTKSFLCPLFSIPHSSIPILILISLHVIIIYIILILCTPLSPLVYNTLNLGMQVTIVLIHFGEVLVQCMFGVWTRIYTWSTTISCSERCKLLVI